MLFKERPQSQTWNLKLPTFQPAKKSLIVLVDSHAFLCPIIQLRMELNDEHIWTLMARKLSGEATPEELQELERALQQNPSASYSKEILHDLWQNSHTTDRQYAENRYKELVQQIKSMGIDEGKFTEEEHYINADQSPKSKRKWAVAAYSVAAVAIIALGIIFYINKESSSNELKDNHAQNTISTRNGSKTSLVLPDGTKVWLNSGSEMTYDKNYGNKIREISLSGEAYFDVVKNADKPFIIHTSKLDIKVLGTAFNVKCYPGEKTTETSLVRGSIEVTLKDRQEKLMLKPNEKLVINNEEPKAGSKPVEGKPIAVSTKSGISKPIISVSHLTLFPSDSTVVETAWVQNKLVFSSETFEEIALKMERWYNISIAFNSEVLKTERLTGSFEKETLPEALNALQLATPFSYSIKNNKVSIDHD